MAMAILQSVILDVARIHTLSKHEGLLNDLHLAENVSLLLLQLLQSRGVSSGLCRTQVCLLKDVNLQLLLLKNKSFNALNTFARFSRLKRKIMFHLSKEYLTKNRLKLWNI